MGLATLVLADARFPGGGHVHSGGLEDAVSRGLVTDVDDLASFLHGRLCTAGLLAAVFAAAATHHTALLERSARTSALHESSSRTSGLHESSTRTSGLLLQESSARISELHESSARTSELYESSARTSGPDESSARATRPDTGPAAPAPPDPNERSPRATRLDESSTRAGTLDESTARATGLDESTTRATGPDESSARAGEPATSWAELDSELDARTPSAAQREASRAQGRATLRAVRAAWPSPVLDALVAAHPRPHHPLLVGVVAGIGGEPPAEAARCAAYLAVSGPASAAVRLLGLDPFAVNAVVVALGPAMDRVVDDAAAAADGPVADLPAPGSPMLDLMAESHVHHHTERVRLFAS